MKSLKITENLHKQLKEYCSENDQNLQTVVETKLKELTNSNFNITSINSDKNSNNITLGLDEESFLNLINLLKNSIINKPIGDIDKISNILLAIKNMENFYNYNVVEIDLSAKISELAKTSICEFVKTHENKKEFTDKEIKQIYENVKIYEELKKFDKLPKTMLDGIESKLDYFKNIIKDLELKKESESADSGDEYSKLFSSINSSNPFENIEIKDEDDNLISTLSSQKTKIDEYLKMSSLDEEDLEKFNKYKDYLNKEISKKSLFSKEATKELYDIVMYDSFWTIEEYITEQKLVIIKDIKTNKEKTIPATEILSNITPYTNLNFKEIYNNIKNMYNILRLPYRIYIDGVETCCNKMYNLLYTPIKSDIGTINIIGDHFIYYDKDCYEILTNKELKKEYFIKVNYWKYF